MINSRHGQLAARGLHVAFDLTQCSLWASCQILKEFCCSVVVYWSSISYVVKMHSYFLNCAFWPRKRKKGSFMPKRNKTCNYQNALHLLPFKATSTAFQSDLECQWKRLHLSFYSQTLHGSTLSIHSLSSWLELLILADMLGLCLGSSSCSLLPLLPFRSSLLYSSRQACASISSCKR